MSTARKMLDAMVHEGRGPKAAWLMFVATYTYTRSWDGAEGPDGEPMEFGRWYSVCAAFRCAGKYLW